MASSQATYFVVQFAASIVLARLISPEEMGIYALALAVSSTLSILQASGLTAFVVREPEIGRDLLATTFTLNAVISLAVSVLIACAGLKASDVLNEPGVANVLLAMAVLPVIGIFEFLPAACLEREARFKPIALINGFRIVVSQCVSVGFAFAGFSFMSLAYGQIAGALFSAAAYLVIGRHLTIRVGLTQWRRVLAFGLQMLTLTAVFTIGGRLSDILLGKIVGLAALGLYSRASNLNNLIQENIYMVAVRVLLVDVSARARSGASLRGSYLMTIEFLTALLWPAFAGLAIVAGPFITAAYGARWAAAAPPLQMLALASMIHLTISLSWQLFVVRQEVALQIRIEVFRSAAALAMFTVGCTFGLTWAATARVAEALMTVALYRPHIERMTDTRAADFLPIYGRSLFLTLLAVAPAAFFMIENNWSNDTPPFLLSGALLVGAVLWLIGIVWLDHPCAQELRHWFGRSRLGGGTAPS